MVYMWPSGPIVSQDGKLPAATLKIESPSSTGVPVLRSYRISFFEISDELMAQIWLDINLPIQESTEHGLRLVLNPRRILVGWTWTTPFLLVSSGKWWDGKDHQVFKQWSSFCCQIISCYLCNYGCKTASPDTRNPISCIPCLSDALATVSLGDAIMRGWYHMHIHHWRNNKTTQTEISGHTS